MRLENVFLQMEGLSASNKEIKCALREVLFQLTGRSFRNIEYFLKQIGIKNQLKHGIFFRVGANIYFICTSELNTTVEIEIEKQNEELLIISKQYEVGDKPKGDFRAYTFEYKEKGEQLIIINERVIHKNGKKLECRYLQEKIIWKLIIDNEHTLEVQIRKHIEEPKENGYKVIKKCKEYENYLLGLSSSLKIPEVYDKMIQLLKVSKDDVVGCIKFITSVKKQF